MGYVIMGSNGAHWGLSVLCILCSRSYKVREAIASRKSGSEGRRPKGTLFQNILIVYIIIFLKNMVGCIVHIHRLGEKGSLFPKYIVIVYIKDFFF